MERAKDLNGFLTLLQQATHKVGQAAKVLSERQDTESQIQFATLSQLRDELEFAGRDLAGGVIDLREIAFDERAWSLLFSEPVIPLASETFEPVRLPEPEVVRTPERESIFDFDGQPQDFGLGIPDDLLEGIDTDTPTQDDTPTVPILEP